MAVSKYAITCLGLAVAISAFATELRSWRQQVNINQATVAELKAKLPFLTHRKSRDIVAARRKQPFESIEQLRHVAGIDDETFKAISPHARIYQESLQSWQRPASHQAARTHLADRACCSKAWNHEPQPTCAPPVSASSRPVCISPLARHQVGLMPSEPL